MLYRLEGQYPDDYMDDVEVVDVYEHNEIIDEIEERVNEAIKLIENIRGIDAVEACKKKLKALANDLY